MLPHYWVTGWTKNGMEARLRMRDILSSAVLEESFGNQFSELIYAPHAFHYKRKQGFRGFFHADDPRVMIYSNPRLCIFLHSTESIE